MRELTLDEVEHVSGGDAASLSTNLTYASLAVGAVAVYSWSYPPVGLGLVFLSFGLAGFATAANAYAGYGGGGGKPTDLKIM